MLNYQDKKILIITRKLPVIEFLSCFYSLTPNSLNIIKTNNTLSINYFEILLKNNFSFFILLNLRFTFNPLFITCLDYFLYKSNKSYNYILNVTSFLTNLRINLHLSLNKKLILPSLSKLFMNTVWLEREIIDFSGISIFGLRDTRRLMLDYLQKREYPNTLKVYDFTYNHFVNDLYTIKWLVLF